MRGAVGGSNTVSAVEHSRNKDEPLARVPCSILPFAPDKVVGRIRLAIHIGHNCTDDDADEDTGKDEKHAKVSDVREKPVQEKDNTAADPGADDEADEDVPRLWLKTGMHQRIHGDDLLTQNRRHGSSAQNPGKAIPESSEETTYTAIFSCSDGGPVVDTTGRRHTRCQFRNRRSNQPVTDRNSDTNGGG